MLPDIHATTENLLASLGWHLRGSLGDIDANSCWYHKVQDPPYLGADGQIGYRRWIDIFPESPQVVLLARGHDVSIDLDEVLLRGSPVITLDLPIPSLPRYNVGSDNFRISYTVPVGVIALQYSDRDSRRIDIPRSRRQLMQARDTFMGLMRYNTGSMRVYSAVSPPTLEDPEPLGYCIASLQGQPIERPEVWRFDATIRLDLAVEAVKVT